MTDPVATFAIETPEQLRAISDPLRQRLLGVMAEPCTVKRAAARLGVPLGRLYHHVDQLAAAGLIQVVGERKVRAAVERTFQAVGGRFHVKPSALAGSELANPGPALARAAVEELLAGAPEAMLHIARPRVRLTPENLTRMEAQLGEFLRRFASDDGLDTELLLIASPRPRTDGLDPAGS